MTAARALFDTGITEADFQAQVIELAERSGWRWFHVYDMRRSPAGWPDLVLVKPGHPVWYVELKTERGRVSRKQQEWLDAFEAARDTRVAVWRPRDWDRVAAVLTESW